MTTLKVDPAVGLPSGNPVVGSVGDGVSLPYSLDLKGRPTAHLVLSFDGVTVADVPSAGPSGTITVPARHAALHRADGVQIVLTALDQSGAQIARAATNGCIADGAVLPPTIKVFTSDHPSGLDVTTADTVWVTAGDTVRVQAALSSGAPHITITGFSLTVDDASILDEPASPGGSGAWVAATWRAPAESGQHTMRLAASVDGDTTPTTQTFAMQVQPGGRFVMDNASSMAAVDPGSNLALGGTLKVNGTYQPVAGASVQAWWQDTLNAPWTQVGAPATTDAQGHFGTTIPVARSGTLQVRTTGVAGVVGPTASDLVPIAVQAHISLSVDKRSASPGTALTFTLSGPALMAGTSGLLQLWNGMYWSTVGHHALDDTGKATISYVVSGPGSYKFGALTGYTASFAPTQSDDLTVTVR